MDKFNEPGFEPGDDSDTLLEPETGEQIAILTGGNEVSVEFIESVLADTFVARHGKKGARRRAIKALRNTAIAVASIMSDTVKERDALEDELAFMYAEYAASGTIRTPLRSGAEPSHLDTRGAESAANCVINEHAHGDDSHESPWAHTDPAVDAKLKEEPTPMPAPIEPPPARDYNNPPTYEPLAPPPCKESPAVPDEAPYERGSCI